MSKRLQVVLEDTEMRRFHRAARRAGLTLSEWARQALRQAERETAVGNADEKLRAIRNAVAHDFPTADIDEMLDQIERGYTQDIG